MIEPSLFVRNAYYSYLNALPSLQKSEEKTTNIGVSSIISSSSYLDKQIYDEIIETVHNVHSVSYSFVNTGVSMFLCYSKRDPAWERLMFHYANFLIYLLQEIHPLKRDLKIVLIDYRGKKRLPTNGQGFTPYHVNSGVTISYGNSGTVIVYRREEMIKVLTHEMIHFFGIDAKVPDQGVEAFLSEHFGVKCQPINVNESFVDSLACYINTVMYTFFSKPKDFRSAFKRNLLREIRFVVSQGSKALKHTGYPGEVCEKTHVTSYYVIKSLVYLNIKRFMEYLVKHRFVLKDMKAYAYIADLNDVDLVLKVPSVGTTMRMSSLDIERLLSGKP